MENEQIIKTRHYSQMWKELEEQKYKSHHEGGKERTSSLYSRKRKGANQDLKFSLDPHFPRKTSACITISIFHDNLEHGPLHPRPPSTKVSHHSNETSITSHFPPESRPLISILSLRRILNSSTISSPRCHYSTPSLIDDATIRRTEPATPSFFKPSPRL